MTHPLAWGTRVGSRDPRPDTGDAAGAAPRAPAGPRSPGEVGAATAGSQCSGTVVGGKMDTLMHAPIAKDPRQWLTRTSTRRATPAWRTRPGCITTGWAARTTMPPTGKRP